MEGLWDVGIVHFMAYPDTIKGAGPVLETIKEIVDDPFFQAIEITWIKDDKVRKKAKELLGLRLLKVGYGAQPPLLINKLDLNAEDDGQREEAVSQVKVCIDEAIFMGAQGLAVLSGPDPGEGKREKAKGLLIKSLRKLCLYSQEKGGPALILESFDRGIGKNRLIGPTNEAIEVVAEVRKAEARFGLMLDLSHLPLLDEPIEETLQMAKDYLVHVHVGNCVKRDKNHPAYGDEHPPLGIPGGENGREELVRFMRTLREIGYMGTVSFEVKPLKGGSSKELIADTKRIFEEALNKI